MRVLFVGDVFATPGMRAATTYLKQVRGDYDFVIVNGENAAGGFGITRKHFEQLRAAGADVVTLGNHGFDQAEALELLEETTRLLRPANYPPGTPGLGWAIHEVRPSSPAEPKRIAVVQVMGRVFMDAIDDPFRAVDDALERIPAGIPVIVDMHAEATSEKKVMGYHLAGRVAAVIGTHTHVPTADETVFQGTAYVTDVGMTGVQASSIGMAFEEVHERFVSKLPRRFRPAHGPASVLAVEIEIEGHRASAIRRIRWDGPHHDGGDDEPPAGSSRPGEGRRGSP